MYNNFFLQDFASITSCGKRRKKITATGRLIKKKKTEKSGKSFVRTVICIPYEKATFSNEVNSSIQIPRAKSKSFLYERNLVATVKIESVWSATKIYNEICDLFKKEFEENLIGNSCFGFDFMTSIPGTKILQKAIVNSFFVWDAAAIEALGKKIVYVLTHSHCRLKNNNATATQPPVS